ncbi:MAG: hypothetical protein AAGA60_26580 [Cyanobacteria bacterium P01_E01_bin.42]
MSRQHQTRTAARKSAIGQKQPQFTAPPVVQPKATQKAKERLSEWKPGGSGIPSPLARLRFVAAVQAKLTIGQPNDRYEQEADRVARKVVGQINSPASTVSQPDAALQGNNALQRKPQPQLQLREAVGGREASTALESEINREKSGGQLLDARLQRSMGEVMGADFSGVGVQRQIQRSAIATPAFKIQSVAPNIIQREPSLDLEKKWPHGDYKKYEKKFDDVDMRKTGVKSGGKKGLGTIGLGPCCALIVACKVQGQGWVVGLHHYSGISVKGQAISITDTYNNLHKEVTTSAKKKGEIQFTRKYLIPGTGSAAHTESIEEFEKKTQFDNDWRTMLASYGTDGHGGSISVTVEEVGHWFKPNDLKIKYYYTK